MVKPTLKLQVMLVVENEFDQYELAFVHVEESILTSWCCQW